MNRSLTCAVLCLSLSLSLGCDPPQDQPPEDQWIIAGNPSVFAIASGEGVDFITASLELAGIAVTGCADGSSPVAVEDVPSDVDLLSSSVQLELPAMADGDSTCRVILETTQGAGTNLLLEGSWTSGDSTGSFTASLTLSDLSFELSPGAVVEETSLVFELGAPDWLRAELLAAAASAGEDIDLSHPLYPMLVAAVQDNSSVMEDADGDGLIDPTEREEGTVGGTEESPASLCSAAVGQDSEGGALVLYTRDPQGAFDWSRATLLGSTADRELHAVSSAGGQLVAVGDGVVLTSQDCETWSSLDVPGGSWVDVAWKPGHYVLIGETGEARWSADGLVWHDEGTDLEGERWRSVTFGEGTGFLAVGKDGVWAISEDGVVWEQGESLGLGHHAYSVAYNDGHFTLVGFGGLTATTLAPDLGDPASWSTDLIDLDVTYKSVVADDTSGSPGFAAVGLSGAATWTGNSGWLPNTTTYPMASIAVADQSFIATSSDGGEARIHSGFSAVSWGPETLAETVLEDGQDPEPAIYEGSLNDIAFRSAD